MLERETKMQPLPAGKDVNISDRAHEESGRGSWSGPFSWCLAQPALPGSKYALTPNGYVLLP